MRGCLFAALGLALTLATPAHSQTCDSSPLLVRNTNVWTRTGPIANRDVLFREGRVVSVESSGSRHYPAVRTIDGTGNTLLPGLIDAHLHLSLPVPFASRDRLSEAAGIAGRQLLRSGVTAGRLHLATIEEASNYKARSLEPCAPMPRLQVGGPGLSGAADRDFGNFQGAKSVDDALEKIERFRGAGIDWLAVHDAERFSPEILSAIGSTARKVGLRLMASGSTPAEIAAALTLDPDTLDYIDRTGEPHYAAAVLESIRFRQDLILVPTPGVPFRTREYIRHPDWLDRAENVEFFEIADRAHVLAGAKKDLIGPDATRAERILQTLPTKFAQLLKLGLPMAIGSDAGSRLHFQGGAIWWELEAWRSFGASHRDALIAATEGGARVLRAGDTGRLSVGSRADFVLYKGDIERGPFDLSRVLAVGKDGVLYVANGKWRPIPGNR